MTLPVTVKADLSEVDLAFQRVDNAISSDNLERFLSGPANDRVKQRARERFESEGKSDIAWAPLAESTIETRIAAGYGAGPINFRTGELQTFVTEAAGKVTGDATAVTFESPGDPGTGEMAVKFEIAQMGSSRAPARPVVGLNVDDALVITALLAADIETTLAGGH